ncbi:MAG: amidohydrolase family protein [Bryobacteraceae bacterium]|jgi:imidazolonepropionase-like amidohydrolase
MKLALLDLAWRRHSCLPGRDSSRPRFSMASHAPAGVPARQTESLRHSYFEQVVLFTGVFAVTLAAATPPIVIQNATILTVTKGTLNGSVLIRDGKIAEVGEKVAVPAGAKVIDASGQFVMPGIIDCHSHIAADSINEGSVSVSSMVGIEDVLNPDDISIYRAVAGGVTTANILHGSANSIGGKCTVIKLRWGKDAHEMIFEGALPGIKFALGENPKRAGNPTGQRIGAGNVQGRYPATRMGVEDVIREAFNEAKAYQQSWKDYDQKAARGEPAVPPRRDLKLEPLVEVLEGRRLVHAHCYRADEILMLLRVADDYGFKIRTLQHVLEGYKVAKEIAAHGAGASTFSDWWAYKMEAFDAIPYNAAIMTRKGVLVSLNSDSDELMRHLNDEAAKTMKYGGLSETEALSLVTINPAKQLMIDNRVGSIEVGKDADLAIFDKHPLSNYAKVEKVFIDGQLYFDRASDLAERGERETEKKKLMDKEKEEQKKNAPAGRGRPAA